MSRLNTLVTSLVKTTLTPIGLCLTLAITTPAMAKEDHHQRHDGMGQILSELSLTATQQQDIRLILKQTREDTELYNADTASLRKEIRDLVQLTEWVQTTVEAAIKQRQSLLQEKALQRASNKNQAWNLLTDKQQAEFVVLSHKRKAELNRLKADQCGPENMGFEGTRKGKGKGKHNKLKYLDLTEAQLASVQTIKTAAKIKGLEIRTKINTFRQVQRELIHSTRFNADIWQTLYSQYQADFLAMAVFRAKTKHDIWTQLTPEQQAEVQGKNGPRGKNNNGNHNEPVKKTKNLIMAVFYNDFCL